MFTNMLKPYIEHHNTCILIHVELNVYNTCYADTLNADPVQL